MYTLLHSRGCFDITCLVPPAYWKVTAYKHGCCGRQLQIRSDHRPTRIEVKTKIKYYIFLFPESQLVDKYISRMARYPNYRLTYFDNKGRAEHCRLLFVLAGVEYEDVRVDMKDWPMLKQGKSTYQYIIFKIQLFFKFRTMTSLLLIMK